MTALYKALVEKFKKPLDSGTKVMVFKLFARHIPLSEHQKDLEADTKGGSINIYIGTPNRIRSLADADTISLSSKKLKSIVFDCSLNKKNFTMLETHETRDDAFAVLALAKKPILKRKLRVYLVR